jgi:hypothetical protein
MFHGPKQKTVVPAVVAAAAAVAAVVEIVVVVVVEVVAAAAAVWTGIEGHISTVTATATAPVRMRQ